MVLGGIAVDFQHVKPKEGISSDAMPHFIKYYHEVETNFLSGGEIVKNVDRRQIKSAFLRLLVSSNSFSIISLRLSISLAILVTFSVPPFASILGLTQFL